MQRFPLLTILSVFLFVQNAGSQNVLQSDRIIPVYPGAVLKTVIEPGDRKTCCTFTTRDSFEKVISFYEKSLNMKSVDPDGLSKQVLALSSQMDLMKKELKPGMKIRFFILKVVEFQGQKGAETFEVVDPGSGEIEFSIMDSQMSEADSHFASEWEGMGEAAGDTPKAKSSDVKILVSALPNTGPPGFNKSEINISDDQYGSITRSGRSRRRAETSYRRLHRAYTQIGIDGADAPGMGPARSASEFPACDPATGLPRRVRRGRARARPTTDASATHRGGQRAGSPPSWREISTPTGGRRGAARAKPVHVFGIGGEVVGALLGPVLLRWRGPFGWS